MTLIQWYLSKLVSKCVCVCVETWSRVWKFQRHWQYDMLWNSSVNHTCIYLVIFKYTEYWLHTYLCTSAWELQATSFPSTWIIEKNFTDLKIPQLPSVSNYIIFFHYLFNIFIVFVTGSYFKIIWEILGRTETPRSPRPLSLRAAVHNRAKGSDCHSPCPACSTARCQQKRLRMTQWRLFLDTFSVTAISCKSIN